MKRKEKNRIKYSLKITNFAINYNRGYKGTVLINKTNENNKKEKKGKNESQ